MDNRTAIFVGRLWNHKRIDLIVKAIALIPDGNLIIVGEGPEKKGLKHLVKSLGLKKRVRFYSSLSNERLDQMYRSATCGVYTPVREPFGIMPLEAASYGMPVVVTQDGGYTAVLDDTCAHIVAPEPERIAEALGSLFSDFETAKQMGAAARKKVENFTWDHTARNLLNLFKKTLTNQRRVISSTGFRTLLGAHYYPWYGTGENERHWNENSDFATVEDLPIQGAYSSNDRNLVTNHLTWAEQAGLDYLVVNLQVTGGGLDADELEAVDLLFDMAAENAPGLSICFMLSCEKADSNSINTALKWLDDNYISRPNYLRLRSRPVIWFFITESFIGHFFHNYSELTETTKEYYRVAASGFCYSKYLPNHYSEYFDGWSIYSPLQVSIPDNWEPLWKTSHRDFVEDKPGKALQVFTICPGFDDTGLTHSQRTHAEFRKIPRENAKIYTRMQEACLDLPDRPDLVVITSFNEFHENTQIEPTKKFGYEYIKETHQFSEKLKSAGLTDPRESSDPSERITTKYS